MVPRIFSVFCLVLVFSKASLFSAADQLGGESDFAFENMQTPEGSTLPGSFEMPATSGSPATPTMPSGFTGSPAAPTAPAAPGGQGMPADMTYQPAAMPGMTQQTMPGAVGTTPSGFDLGGVTSDTDTSGFGAFPTDQTAPAVGVPAEPKKGAVVLPAEAPQQEAAPPAPPVKKGPKPKEEAEKIAEDKSAPVPSEFKGIDTLEVDDPGGNWLVKRMWWERAETRMEKIEAEVDKIMESRMVFFKKRDTADSKTFDPFYVEIGLDQGQLEEVSSYLINELKEKREKQESLSRKEREFLKKLEDKKEDLVKIEKQVVAVRELDNSIDDALTQLVEQINLARKYKKTAQALFKKIGKILDHDKARELYYKMDASWQSIKDIGKYINGTFSKHFNKIIQNAQQQTARIKASMDVLEKEGLGFKEQFKKLQGGDTEKQKEEKQKKRLALQKELEKDTQKSPGWFGRVISSVKSTFNSIWNWISSWWKKPKKEEALSEEKKEVPGEKVVISKEKKVVSSSGDKAVAPLSAQKKQVKNDTEEPPQAKEISPKPTSPTAPVASP